MQRLLIILGVLIALAGLAWPWLSKLPLGRLPGDIVVDRPGFRFFNRHRVVDEKGKVLGYRNLDELRATLKPILLRRTRDSVKLELPPRTTEIVRIPPTDEQRALHRTNMQIVASITSNGVSSSDPSSNDGFSASA